jgi:1,4-alpha-glucan branching enzyme
VRGSLAIILHAHLPFVRHPEQEWAQEESWLFEAITESYVSLLRMVQRLRADAIPFQLALSISPTLAAMLSDTFLLERYLKHLGQLIALTERECERNRADEHLLPLSQFYLEFFAETRRIFIEEWKGDLLGIVSQLANDGTLELIASAATHAILPILQRTPPAARAQVAIGCDFFRETFSREPAGFWLPECAHAPGIDELLQGENIRWFVVDAHALEHAHPPARRGTFAPCFTPAGPAAFARDVELSAQIWSAELGYPGDSTYRDFYRDIGFDLTKEELAPLSHAQGGFTGIKYFRVTGKNVPKEIYVRARAEETARIHAQHFVERCQQHLTILEDDNAILVAPFDAELFGHWWFEGPIFLEHVIRIAAEAGLRLSSPGDYLLQHATLQVVRPAMSTWGDKGYLDVWLDEKCAWIYPHLHAANKRMVAFANRYAGNASSQQERALRQLARELLLAQASDWPFHIRNETVKEYATQRVRDHLSRFNQLATALEENKADDDFLAQCEGRDNLLPHVQWRHFANCDSERLLSFRAKSRNL